MIKTLPTSHLIRHAKILGLGVAMLGAISTAPAAVLLVDFNTVDATGYPAPGISAWNAFATPSNITGGILKDTTGSTAAGITLSYTGALSDSTTVPSMVFNNATGGPSWVTTNGSLSLTSAAADAFFTLSTVTLSFSNIAAGNTVSLDLFASRAANSGGLYEYSLDGGSTWLGFTVMEKSGVDATTDGWNSNTTQTQAYNNFTQGNNQARYMGFDPVAISGGTLQVRVTMTSSFALVNAMQLTVVPVPEPTACVLLIGGVAVVALRRSRLRSGLLNA